MLVALLLVGANLDLLTVSAGFMAVVLWIAVPKTDRLAGDPAVRGRLR